MLLTNSVSSVFSVLTAGISLYLKGGGVWRCAGGVIHDFKVGDPSFSPFTYSFWSEIKPNFSTGSAKQQQHVDDVTF